MNTPENNFLDVSCPICGVVPKHGHFCNDMNTQNTFHSPDEDPALVEIDRLHNNETGEERGEPKAVQSEVEEIVHEFDRLFPTYVELLQMTTDPTSAHKTLYATDWLREKLTTYQHRIEEARRETANEILKSCEEDLEFGRQYGQAVSLKAKEKCLTILAYLTPKEPNDTEI